MKKLEFKILGLSFESENNYTDEGFVTSIHVKTEEILRRYGIPLVITPRFDVITLGRYMAINKDYYIFYKDLWSEPENIHTRAHEETHVIDNMGRLDILKEMLFQRHGVNIDLHKVGDVEVRAQLGALSALYDKGFSPKDLPPSYINPSWDKAIEIFNQRSKKITQ